MDGFAIPEWLVRASWQGGLMAGAVLALRWLLGRRFPLRLGYALWLLIAVRLLMPALPQSSFSLYGSLHGSQHGSLHGSLYGSSVDAPKSAVRYELASTSVRPVAMEAPKALPAPFPWRTLIAAVWVCGALFFLTRIIATSVGLRRRLARGSRVVDERLEALLAECRRDLGIQRPIRMVESDAVAAPSLAGFFRPVLCLPRGLAASLNDEELRDILQHELTHLKRWDIAVNWLFSLLQAVHWFNPLVWAAASACRADRESLCDAAVLARRSMEERTAYGFTLIKLLETCREERAATVACAFFGTRWEIKRRIMMIQTHRSTSPLRQLTAIAALVLAAAVTLTDAYEPTAPAVTEIPKTAHTADADGVQIEISTRFVYPNTANLKAAVQVLRGDPSNLLQPDGGVVYMDAAAVKELLEKLEPMSGCLLAPKLTMFNGTQTQMNVENSHNYIADYEVLEAGLNPVVKTYNTGIQMGVTAQVAPGSQDVKLAFDIKLNKHEPPQVIFVETPGDANTGSINLPIELPNLSVQTKQTTAMIPDGKFAVYSLPESDPSKESRLVVVQAKIVPGLATEATEPPSETDSEKF